MSAAQNKRLMQEIFAKVAIGDGSSFVAHLADDVTMRVTGQYSWSQTFKGKQSVLDEKPSFYAFANETRNLTGAEVFAQYSSTPK